jgi:hypothetical protein
MNKQTVLPGAPAEARAWFRNAGLGMFLHWGVYSVMGRGEWVKFAENMPDEAVAFRREGKCMILTGMPVRPPDPWCTVIALEPA